MYEVSLCFVPFVCSLEKYIVKCVCTLADGYARSEGVAVMLLQKAKFAKRIYAKIVHSEVEICGDRMTPLISPVREPFIKLLEQFCETSGVDPGAVQFLEADGSGVKVSRVAEIDASNLLESILLKIIYKNCFKCVMFR
jgi:3-oxoacyl-(acyl-carrier-protein) synthase